MSFCGGSCSQQVRMCFFQRKCLKYWLCYLLSESFSGMKPCRTIINLLLNVKQGLILKILYVFIFLICLAVVIFFMITCFTEFTWLNIVCFLCRFCLLTFVHPHTRYSKFTASNDCYHTAQFINSLHILIF